MDDVLREMSGPGYEHPILDIFVPESKTFEYAMEQIESNKDKQNDFVEWFFRNWYWTGED